MTDSSESAAPAKADSPRLRKHEGFRSELLGNQRDLIVYLPPQYPETESQRFPVFYLHDASSTALPRTFPAWIGR